MQNASRKIIQVAAAVIVRGDQVCIARRPDHLHQGGKWEFPGGKMEAGESVQYAITRELEEELGIVVQSCQPLIQIRHHYPDKSVCLNVVWVEEFISEPEGLEGQEVRWIPLVEMNEYEFPAANVPIVAAALLPRCYVITPEIEGSVKAFLHSLEQLVEHGYRLFQIRTKQIDAQQWDDLVEGLKVLKQKAPLKILLNSAIDHKAEEVFDGLHLTSKDLLNLNERPSGQWIAASCHNQQELEKAQQLGVDFITLSPFRETQSHPQQDAMGEDVFKRLVDAAKVPVFALGGVGEQDINPLIDLGAQGVAGIRAFWPKSDNASN